MQLDPNLSFQEHANYLRKKTLGKIKLLGRVSHIMDRATALTLYKSLVLPIYDYNDFIYDCIPLKSSVMLQHLQNLCFKMILKVDAQTPTVDVHAEMNMDMLAVRRAKHTAVEMFKIEQHLVPETVQCLFNKKQQCHETRSCTRGDYDIPRKRLEYGKRCFSVRGRKLWHTLPARPVGI